MSNKLTETNNCGVKFFFPCIFKFANIQFLYKFICIFELLSNKHMVLQGAGLKISFERFVDYTRQKFLLLRNFNGKFIFIKFDIN